MKTLPSKLKFKIIFKKKKIQKKKLFLYLNKGGDNASQYMKGQGFKPQSPQTNTSNRCFRALVKKSNIVIFALNA